MSVYLLNAPAECGILAFDEVKPSGYLHQQRLREGDLRSLKVPSMSYHYLGDPGEGGPYLLYCYPNQAEEESIGSPFTRLVVEGTRGGQTRYYPVNLNRRGYGYTSGTEGVGRNVRYSMDLHLRSEGSLDPDRPDLRAAEVSVKGSMTVYPGNIVVGDEGDVVHVWCEVYPQDTAVSFNKEDLEYERERGIFDYEFDQGGHGVLLRLRSRGSALINVSAGPPVDDGTFVVVAVRSPS